MDASEALLRAIAWRLGLLVIAVFVARTVPDGRHAELQASAFREGSFKEQLVAPDPTRAGSTRIPQ